MYECVGEHYSWLNAPRKDSQMIKHSPLTLHWTKSKFEVIGIFKDCLTRQMKEAVMLQARPNSLNSTGEFGRCEIPRLVIEEDKDKGIGRQEEGRGR